MTPGWTTGRFTDLEDGGRALAEAVGRVGGSLHGADVVVAGVVPNGVPAALAVAAALDAPLVGLEVERPAAPDPERPAARDPEPPGAPDPEPPGAPDPEPQGAPDAEPQGRPEPLVRVPEGVAGRTVVVVDDAVETGTAARLAAAALRAAGASRIVLAVPVCPREAEAAMLRGYDEVVAVVRPFARRALTWHYAAFEPLDPDVARARISAYTASR